MGHVMVAVTGDSAEVRRVMDWLDRMPPSPSEQPAQRPRLALVASGDKREGNRT